MREVQETRELKKPVGEDCSLILSVRIFFRLASSFVEKITGPSDCNEVNQNLGVFTMAQFKCVQHEFDRCTASDHSSKGIKKFFKQRLMRAPISDIKLIFGVKCFV